MRLGKESGRDKTSINDKVMKEQVDYSAISPESKDWLLKTCLERFNSISKSDYDVAFFHVLMENGYGEKSDFELSRLLMLTETKIKNLRYRCNLVYPMDEDYERQLKEILRNAAYKRDGNKIQFCVKDKMLRSYANNLLTEDGNFADSSFNSDIISLTPMDMVDLMTKLYGGKTNEDYEQVRKLVRDSMGESLKDFPMSKSEVIKEGAMSFVKDAVGKIAPRFSDFLIDSLSGQLEKILEKLMNTKK